MNKRKTGTKYEEQAAAYVVTRGLVLLEKNYRCRQGEVYLIGVHEDCLVFIEVKYRKNARSGMPEEAVDKRKQTKICLVSDYYRLTHPSDSQRQVRYDVVAICGEDTRWHQNAFSYVSQRQGGGW